MQGGGARGCSVVPSRRRGTAGWWGSWRGRRERKREKKERAQGRGCAGVSRGEGKEDAIRGRVPRSQG